MKFVATWSVPALGAEPSSAADRVRLLDAAGFDGIAINDHVVGGAAERARSGENVHTVEVPTSDPFVFLSFAAGVAPRLELHAEVLVLPQRQTLVVAKQAAELDRLSGGRLRLGIGIGRNWMEYEALGADFSSRGALLEEQVAVLRALWTQELVTFDGRWHRLDRIGLNPRPERSIPIWMGAFVGGVNDRVLRRAALLADGWLPQLPPSAEFAALLDRFRALVVECGRPADAVEIECVATLRPGADEAGWLAETRWFADHGATHVVARTIGFDTPDAHLAALCRWHDIVSPARGE